MSDSLKDLTKKAKEKLNYPNEQKVYVVLEEDGTEVDDEEYFQTLPENTVLMILFEGDSWSPIGASFSNEDETDNQRSNLDSLLSKLHSDLGSIVLFSGQELELLAEFDPEQQTSNYDIEFLKKIQEAADRHLLEKREIKDALGLLKIYHQSNKRKRKD